MTDPIQSVLQTSGTYNFAPGMGETVLYSYGLCGVRRTALTQQHFEDARLATNMLLGRWSSQGVNLWQVDKQQVQLIQGQSTYQVPSNTIVILDAYFTINPGSNPIDRIMMPVSRSEYASYPNKQQQGSPTVFWMDRLLSPTVTLWPVPNGQQAYFTYYRLRQTQDANMTNGQNVEIPIYFLEAYALGLAYRLALSWAPDKVAMIKPLADEAWTIASTQNTETANIYVSPMVNGYWRT
jgi:hypothetical protein